MARRYRLQLFVLIDALGWRVIDGRNFLSDLLPHRNPLRTVFGYSSAAIPTILTGLPPARNGHWNLFYYDPEGSPFRWLRHFSFLPDSVLDNRVTRKLLKEIGRRVLGLGPLFECCVSPRLLPWFNWVEKRNVYDHEGIPGARSIFDELAKEGIPHRVYTYHRWTDAQILREAQRDLQAGKDCFFFLYLSEMDRFLHQHRGDSRKVERQLDWYGSRLRELFEAAQKVDPEAGLTVFSDHGMTPVHHHYDLVKEVESLGFTMPADYLAVYDSTMARFWFFAERARREVTAHLHALRCGRMMSEAELDQLGVLFPDRRYGEVIFLLNPGWLFSRSDFNGRGWAPAAMHGYHPDDPDSDGIFLSNRQPAEPVRTIADVHQLMQAAADIRASGDSTDVNRTMSPEVSAHDAPPHERI